MHAYLHTIFMQITHHTRTLMYDSVLNKNIKTRCLMSDFRFSQQWLWRKKCLLGCDTKSFCKPNLYKFLLR